MAELYKVENLAEIKVEQNGNTGRAIALPKQINLQKIEPEPVIDSIARGDDNDNEWVVCCSNSSSHAIKYLVQVIVSMTILGFAIAMIASGHDDAVYWSLITLIVGVFVPSPTLAKG